MPSSDHSSRPRDPLCQTSTGRHLHHSFDRDALRPRPLNHWLTSKSTNLATAPAHGDRDRHLLTKRQLADQLTVSTRTVERWQHRGMPSLLLGAERRYVLHAVLAFLQTPQGC
ncbi:MAG: hypothetical protein ACXVHB_26835 [Solirubrobacteraceae bacterium]